MTELKLNDRELEKPIGLDSQGRNLKHADVVERKEPMTPLATLDFAGRKKLVLERNELEDDFEIEKLGGERLGRRQLLKEIEAETETGRWWVDAEVSFLIDLHAKLEGKSRTEGLIPSRFTPHVEPDQYKWIPREYEPYILRRAAVFTESNHDTITTSGSDYRTANVHPQFSADGFGTICLTDSTNVRSTFETKMQLWWVTFTSGIGHGGPTVYTGNSGSYLWEVGSYSAAEPNGKVVHLLSCLTAQTLGPDLVANGAEAYFGYHPSFYITWDYPDVFWACDSAIDHGFSFGMMASEVHDLALYVYNTMISFMTGIHTPTATTLTGDRDGLRSPVSGSEYGSESASISVYPFIVQMEKEIAQFAKEKRYARAPVDLEEYVAGLTRIK